MLGLPTVFADFFFSLWVDENIAIKAMFVLWRADCTTLRWGEGRGCQLCRKGRGEAAEKWASGCLGRPVVQQPCVPAPLSCCGLRQSLDHPEWILEQELPQPLSCCQCLFGFGFILAVSFIFIFGGLFLLPKLIKQPAIRPFYWIKYTQVPCSGLPRMGESRSNIIDLQIFFKWLMLLWQSLETTLK